MPSSKWSAPKKAFVVVRWGYVNDVLKCRTTFKIAQAVDTFVGGHNMRDIQYNIYNLLVRLDKN